MKKFRFLLLALGVAAITFAFTPSSPSKNGPTATVYAFNPITGVFLGSGADSAALKTALCPGANQVMCAEVWSSKTPDNQPAGTHLANIKKPQQP